MNEFEARKQRARAIAEAGGVREAVASGALAQRLTITVSEAVVMGLAAQDVRKFIGIFGHGSTDIAEVLRSYEAGGLVKTYPVRNEVEAAHIATALRWRTGEKAAVFTSIGPGALQALAGSLAAASDGIGVWHLYADETTENEGPNMQQLPVKGQDGFLKLVSQMGAAYNLHTPQALPEALRRGRRVVDDPSRGQPFYLLLPINVQPELLVDFNLGELPDTPPASLGAAGGEAPYAEAARRLIESPRTVVRVGGGAVDAGAEILELLELVNGYAIVSPVASGAIPASHPRYLGVGGSKGTISGNYAMEHADTLVAVGSRGVCQSDMSRTGYPEVRTVVNINTDAEDVIHYNHTLPFLGSAAETLRALIAEVRAQLDTGTGEADRQPWTRECEDAWRRWQEFRRERFSRPVLFDERWQREVLTQPAAIREVLNWAKRIGATAFFDAGDVQANGFQVADPESRDEIITETGASYMGFSTSAVVAGGIADTPFYAVSLTGDGSFSMNPQALWDATAHGARGCIVLFDNRRQGAISSLQINQYGAEYATSDDVAVDYTRLAASFEGVKSIDGGASIDSLRKALEEAADHDGLSFVPVPVYFGDDPLGGLGAFGRWNVGSWVADTQRLRHEIGM